MKRSHPSNKPKKTSSYLILLLLIVLLILNGAIILVFHHQQDPKFYFALTNSHNNNEPTNAPSEISLRSTTDSSDVKPIAKPLETVFTCSQQPKQKKLVFVRKFYFLIHMNITS